MRADFLIVDADGLAFKAYYALEGKLNYPLAFGVVRSAVKLFRDFGSPRCMALVFDSDPTELKEIFPDYRKGREEPWDLGKEDYDLMLKILVGLGFEVYKKESVEADRIIASLVNRLREAGAEGKIVIWSDDKDFFQLLETYKIEMFGDNRGHMTASKVEKEFGLEEAVLFRDFLIFTGDDVDRIPGILDVEDARFVVNKKGLLEDWFFDSDFEDLPEDLIEILEEKRDEVIRNFKLINLLDEFRRFKPLSFDLSEEKILDLCEKVDLSEGDVERALEVTEQIRFCLGFV